MRVSLFVTCLVDTFFPQIGTAVAKVLTDLGQQVTVPAGQTCCGQPAYNAGQWHEARRVARHFLELFADAEVIVAPSGSCVHMIKTGYPTLFADEPETLARVEAIANRTYEFSQFLVDVWGVEDIGATYHGSIVYHDSCHLLRGLGVADQPRRLLRNIAGVEERPLAEHDVCCGFGGVFSIKMPELSSALLERKIKNVVASGADAIVAADTGCLMQIGGGLRKRQLRTKVYHLAQLLANQPADLFP